MTYFPYALEIGRYCGIALDLPVAVSRNIRNALRQGASLLATWNPPRVILDPPPSRQFQQGDFYSYHGSSAIQVVSARALAILRPILPAKTEILPLLHTGPELFFLNILETTDCINISESVLSQGEIIRFSLNHESLEGRHIVRTTFGPKVYALVDEVFRATVEDNGLTGLIFNPLPLVGTSTPSLPSPFARKTTTAEENSKSLKEVEAKLAGRSPELRNAMAAMQEHLGRTVQAETRRINSERQIKSRALDDSVFGHLTAADGSWRGQYELPWSEGVKVIIQSKDGSPPDQGQRQAFAMFKELADGVGSKDGIFRLQELVEGQLARVYGRIRNQWIEAAKDPQDDRSAMQIELNNIGTSAGVWNELTHMHLDIPADQSQGRIFQLTWEAKAFDEILLSVIVKNGEVISAGEYNEI